MTELPLESALALDGGPQSAAAARRFLTEVLRRWGCVELVEDAVLCVSEIVANAVVHAATPCELRVTWQPPRLRVEVQDQSSRSAIGPRTISALSEFDNDSDNDDDGSLAAMSGRGLFIVASLSEAVGETVVEGGKIVWFELEEHGPGVEAGLAAIVQQVADESSVVPGDRGPLDGVLPGVPVALAVRSEDHIADMRRELKLVGQDHAVAELLPALESLGGAFPYRDSGAEHVRVAAGVHRSHIDLKVPVSSDYAGELRRILGLLIQADDLATAGRLLARPVSADVRRFWAWAVEQVAAQVEGRPPSPFAGAQ